MREDAAPVRYDKVFPRWLTKLTRRTALALDIALLYLSLKRSDLTASDRRQPPRPTGQRLAMVVHVFYPELLPDLLRCHARFPADATLYITTSPDLTARVAAAVAHIPHAQVHVFPNRGRDLGPFVALLRTGIFDRYDAVLKLHTKRSPHLIFGNLVRRALYFTLAGHPRIVSDITSFFGNSRLGIVGWRPLFFTTDQHWARNDERIRILAARLKPAANPTTAFFGGSMFWFRPAALKSIAEAEISQDEFEEESGQVDGTLHHALERCFCIAAAALGYETRDTQGRILQPPPGAPEQR